MNTKLRQKAKKKKKEREKNFLKVMKNEAFEKIMENVKKHRY